MTKHEQQNYCLEKLSIFSGVKTFRKILIGKSMKLLLAFFMFATIFASNAENFKRPLVLGTGRYASKYRAMFESAGCQFKLLEIKDFKKNGIFKHADLIFCSNLGGKIPAGIEKKLYDYVTSGGAVLLTLNTFPVKYFFKGAGTISGKAMDIRRNCDDKEISEQYNVNVPEWTRYGLWGASILVKESPDIHILAKWEVKRHRATTNKRFLNQPAVIAAKFGRGRLAFAGALLNGGGEKLFNPVLHWLLPRLPDIEIFKAQVNKKYPKSTDIYGLKSEKVAIFRESGFVNAGMPKATTPEFIAAALEKKGISYGFIDATALGDPNQLNVKNFNTAILSYGESVPVSAYSNLKRFLSAGGGIVCPAGLPFSVPCAKRNGKWNKMYPDAIKGLIVNTILWNWFLPVGKYYTPQIKAAYDLNLSPELQPGQPSIQKANTCNECILPSYYGSIPLSLAVSASGEVVAVPVSFIVLNPAFPLARFVFINYTGENHPWNPIRKTAINNIQELVSAVLKKNYLKISDLSTEYPCYTPGEKVNITVNVKSMSAMNVNFKIAVFPNNSDKPVFSERRQLSLKSGNNEFSFSEKVPVGTVTNYDIFAEVSSHGSPASKMKAAFIVKQPDMKTIHFGMEKNNPMINGKSVWLSGVNLYSEDPRGAVPFRRAKHPVPAIWQRDISLLRLCGGNAIRQHYAEYSLNAKNLSSQKYDFAQRLVDAFFISARNMVTVFDPLTFSFIMKNSASFRKNAKKETLLYDSPERTKVMKYLSALGGQTMMYHNIAWEIINEPDLFGHELNTTAKRKKLKSAVYDTIKLALGNLIGNKKIPVGIGNTFATESAVWNQRDNLRFLKWSNTHLYGDACFDNARNPAFTLNYGRPSLLGEAGHPNGSFSGDTRLGNWQFEYQCIMAIVLAERSMGFTNFYLVNGMTHPLSPEWGMLRHDLTEKNSFKEWKKWNYLLKSLNKDDYTSPDFWLVYNSNDRLDDPMFIGKISELYRNLLRKGVHTVLMNEHDVKSAPQVPRAAWIIMSDKSKKWADDLKTKLVKLGTKAFANIEPIPTDCRKFADKKLPLKSFYWNYAMPKKTGGTTFVFADAKKENVEFKYGIHSYRLEMPLRSSAIIDTLADGRPCAAMFAGKLYLDGKLLAESKDKRSIVLVSAGNNALSNANVVSVFADNPSQVKLNVSVKNPVKKLGKIFFNISAEYQKTVKILSNELTTKGCSIVDNVETADTIIELGNDSNILQKHNNIMPELYIKGNKVNIAWSGYVKVENIYPRKIKIFALTPAGIRTCMLRLGKIKQIRDYLVGPFMPID